MRRFQCRLAHFLRANFSRWNAEQRRKHDKPLHLFSITPQSAPSDVRGCVLRCLHLEIPLSLGFILPLKGALSSLLQVKDGESCVVSTCEELSYPYRTHPDLAAKLDAEAKDWGVALVGTGVNPGFVMDKLVVTLAAVSQRVEHVKALRIVDASKRRLPLQKKIGAGMSVDEFRGQVAAGVIKHVGLPESVAMVADSLNLPVDQITETIEPVVARERVQTEFLTVEAGQAAGVHQIARGLGAGKELVYLELQMYVGAKDSADTIELQGHPTIRLVIPGGSHGDIATASVVVNSIPVILDAPAGLRTSRDLPIGFFSPNAKP